MRNRQEDTNDIPLETTRAAETIVGTSLKIEGDLKSDGDIRIDGEVVGSVTTKGDVHIGPQAAVTATVMAANAFVAGRVAGDIVAQKRIALESTARVKGNLTSQELSIAQGAQFNGASTMAGQEASREATIKKVSRPAALVSV
ncbi:MAG: polymer-forming cytoskeletal protein [Candidatus Andersenbacteria bacterium]